MAGFALHTEQNNSMQRQISRNVLRHRRIESPALLLVCGSVICNSILICSLSQINGNGGSVLIWLGFADLDYFSGGNLLRRSILSRTSRTNNPARAKFIRIMPQERSPFSAIMLPTVNTANERPKTPSIAARSLVHLVLNLITPSLHFV